MEENKTKTELTDKQTEKVSGGDPALGPIIDVAADPTVKDGKCGIDVHLCEGKCTLAKIIICNGCKYNF